nr:MFS-type transporter SLC18B1-like [Leptinotarsa decemlineata]
MDCCNYEKTELSSISKTVNEKLQCEKKIVNGLDASNTLDKDERKKEKVIKFSCRQKVCLAILAAAEFTSFCSMSIMAPFYPQEAANKGMSESMAGFVFGYYALIIFLSSPFFGKILPKVGAKFLFIAGMFSSGVCSIGFGTLHYIEEYTWFTVASFVVRGVEALGASAYSTAGYVIIVNIFPENAGTVRGILETFVGLGMSAGPGIGGLLYAVGGFGLPFYVMGIIMICITPLNMCLVPKCEKISVDKNSGSITNLLQLPPVITTCFIMVTASMTWGFLDPTLEPHLRKFQLSATNVGLIFLILSATYGISCPICGYLSDKLNSYWWLMIVGLFGSSATLLFLGPSPMLNLFIEDSVWLNIVALSVLGVFAAMALMPTYQYILDSSLEHGYADNLATHSVIAGLWSSIYSLGDVLGPILGGTLLENYHFPVSATSFAVLNFVVGVFSLIFFVYVKKTPNVVNFPKVSPSHTDGEYYKADIKNIAVEGNPEVIKSS